MMYGARLCLTAYGSLRAYAWRHTARLLFTKLHAPAPMDAMRFEILGQRDRRDIFDLYHMAMHRCRQHILVERQTFGIC